MTSYPVRQSGIPETLSPAQRQIVAHPREGEPPLLVQGDCGAGKSTALAARLCALVREGRRPYEMLVIVPQRAQAARFEQALALLDGPSRGKADIVTLYSLARRSVALFWPLVAGAGSSAGAAFSQPQREPTFLTIETAQFFMWQIVEPLIQREGYFRDLAIRRGRLLSQLIDNLNKSALVGFPYTEILSRLRGAWVGDADHINSYWQAQDCAIRFRSHCLEHNLLDFSLTMEVFAQHLVPHEVFQRYFRARYRHLLVDNLEEQVPVAHDLIRWAMAQCDSTVLAYEPGGGHRVFLGVDPQGAAELAQDCERKVIMEGSFQASPDALALAAALRRALRLPVAEPAPQGRPQRAIVASGGGDYWISMIRWAADQVSGLIQSGVPAGEIALVAPYVSEVMRFTIEEELASRGIAMHLLRPSTPLRENPVIRALLVLCVLAHPQWEIEIQNEPYTPPPEDVALLLGTILADLDPIRARLLAEEAVPPGARTLADLSGGEGSALAGEALGRLWERVGFGVRQRYETLRVWLETYQAGEPEPVDLFLSRLFGDLLSRPGYGFGQQPDGGLDDARAYGRLVESANKFRQAVESVRGSVRGSETRAPGGGVDGGDDAQRLYVQLILGGIASAEYLLDWPDVLQASGAAGEAVILAPAYTYLTRDLRSDYQVWLDLGSDGWWQRPNQPLTHPYILSRHWPPGRPWRDVEEQEANREALGRIVWGLAARCGKGVMLATSQLGINGVEQDGRLQRAVLRAIRPRRSRDG